MRNARWLMVPMLMLSAFVFAQSASPSSSHASDQFAEPTKAATAASDFHGHVDADAAATKSHFKFKQGSEHQRDGDNPNKPWNEPPPSAHDKASVMGSDRAWSNGRPPVECAQTPMDAACH